MPTDQQIADLDRRLRRLEALVRAHIATTVTTRVEPPPEPEEEH